MRLNLHDRFNKQLTADPVQTLSRRQVSGAAFSFVTPRVPSNPRLLHVANDVAEMLGLSAEDRDSDEFRDVFSGGKVMPGTRPYAMCYGGHQFGSWAGQLGDGRAINLAEVEHAGKHWTLQLKGAGETPYSRTADGLAVLRSSVREHLCSEAMHHLGVPTTRSLCLLTTGDQVLRDIMYDGHPEMETGAVICRVAPSFIRFGNFEIFASRHDLKMLRELTDYTIRHYYPEIETGTQSGYGDFFHEVCQRTLRMMVHWQRVGFVHGVMNTDNMSIHGDTIDYGPYGWLEGYDPNWTPNTTDRMHHRYAFGNQPQIALWNLVQLANALYPLVGEASPFESALQQYQHDFNREFTRMQAEKIGLTEVIAGDEELLDQLDAVLQITETDMTIFFRLLGNVKKSEDASSDSEFLATIRDAFYAQQPLGDEVTEQWRDWFSKYLQRLNASDEPDATRRERMNRVNPKYVLRNYMAQTAIDAAEQGDTSLIGELYELLRAPYDEQPEHERWFAKRPEWARHKVGCSMLSCSS
ncbi:protein adenylyltransferase SelO [Novipirellula caenicola]|uniref:Protein nucleotidyltransferase YdiU n=1 Tax=Novipirellula caenicola TaxID=1536901 RepID=A0ABP9VV05_9BACT